MATETGERTHKRVVPPPRRRPTPSQLVLRWSFVLLLLAALVFLGLRVLRAGSSLPNVTLAAEDVGALNDEELRERIGEIAARREAEEVVVRRPARDGSPAAERSYPRARLGYQVDVEETIDRIMQRGRQANPLAAFADQVKASFTTIEIAPVVSLDEHRFDRWIARVQEQLATAANSGGIDIRGTKVDVQLPRSGVAIEEEGLRERAEEVVFDDRLVLEAPIETVDPAMTAAQVRRAAARARNVVSGPVTLRNGGREARLTAREVASVVSARNVEDEEGARIELRVRRRRLERVVQQSLRSLGRAPKDASFELTGGRVRVVEGSPGVSVDSERLADSLLRIATSDDRAGRAPVEEVRPEFSTRDARALNIDEQVSTFTTHHSCCEPRVENIHRIADIIDGTVVRPGETFSINGTVGPRTREKGFVPAPSILNGEYVEEVGGGISQFATTTFNAVFFGGYEFLEYKAHSYYISRYPMGREATVSYPWPDLEFRNNSDSGIYIDTSYSDTSITVTFYASAFRNVRSASGDPHNYKNPETQCEENKSLGRKERRVVQSGSRGFDISVWRIFGDGERERFDTTYLPVPEIVEKRNC